MNETKKPFDSIEEALYRVNGTLMNSNNETQKIRDEIIEIKELLQQLLKTE